MKSKMISSICFLQSVSLIAVGCFTLWQSEALMIWFISIIGEEFALGNENVVRLDDGAKLLTNPGAMFRWIIPFWIVGCVQITSGATLFYYWLIGKGNQSQKDHG